MTWKRMAATVIPAIVLAIGMSVDARADLVLNGGFETTTGKPSGYSGQLGYQGFTATGWTTTGYNFLYTPGAADSTGGNGESGVVKLWGPASGSANGLPATSPVGGNYVAADSNYEQSPISQMIGGLTVGETYQVGFWWAGAQQAGFDGVTTDRWQVSLGGQTQTTAVVTTPNHGFTGWIYQTFNFKATGTSELLSFLAIGTPPSGAPPFALLDGVTLNAVPEPSTLVLMGMGLIGAGGVSLRRRAKSTPA